METIAFRMNLDPGQAETYKRRHDEIWPELVKALKDAGVRDYRIFLDPETNHLFAVLSRPDDHGMDALPKAEVVQRWWAYMADVMETHEDNTPVLTELREVFHLA